MKGCKKDVVFVGKWYDFTYENIVNQTTGIVSIYDGEYQRNH